MRAPQLAAMRFVGSARTSPTATRKREAALPVDQPVIEGQAQGHDIAQGDRALELPRSPLHGTDGEDGGLPGVEDGDACVHAEDPDVGHGDGPPCSSAGVERASRARAATSPRAWVNSAGTACAPP